MSLQNYNQYEQVWEQILLSFGEQTTPLSKRRIQDDLDPSIQRKQRTPVNRSRMEMRQ